MIGRIAKWVLGAVAALVLLAVLGGGVLLWLSPPCLLGCDTLVTGPEARSRVDAALDHPLPASARVTHLLHGGFQDRFVQIRLTVPRTDLPAVLAAFGVDPRELAAEPGRRLGASPADWWPIDGMAGLMRASGDLRGFHAAEVATIPDPQSPDHALIFVFAYQI
jgi:hypothetical protein